MKKVNRALCSKVSVDSDERKLNLNLRLLLLVKANQANNTNCYILIYEQEILQQSLFR